MKIEDDCVKMVLLMPLLLQNFDNFRNNVSTPTPLIPHSYLLSCTSLILITFKEIAKINNSESHLILKWLTRISVK